MDFYCTCGALLAEAGRDFEPCEQCLAQAYDEGEAEGYTHGYNTAKGEED